MKVASLMTTPVITVRQETTVAELLELLKDKRISGSPVVDDNNRLVGIVSRQDIVLEEIRLMKGNAAPQNTLAQILDAGYVTVSAEGLKSHSTLVKEVMTPAERLHTCGPDTPLSAACATMVKHHVHRLPVLKGRRLVGILSTMDVVRAVGDSTI